MKLKAAVHTPLSVAVVSHGVLEVETCCLIDLQPHSWEPGPGENVWHERGVCSGLTLGGSARGRVMALTALTATSDSVCSSPHGALCLALVLL